MTMYDYDLNQVLAVLHQAGLNRLTLQRIEHGSHHGVVIIGRKG